MWPFDYFLPSATDIFAPVLNLILGLGLMFLGLLAFKYVPGRLVSIIIALGMLGGGLAIILGYVVVF